MSEETLCSSENEQKERKQELVGKQKLIKRGEKVYFIIIASLKKKCKPIFSNRIMKRVKSKENIFLSGNRNRTKM